LIYFFGVFLNTPNIPSQNLQSSGMEMLQGGIEA